MPPDATLYAEYQRIRRTCSTNAEAHRWIASVYKLNVDSVRARVRRGKPTVGIPDLASKWKGRG